MRQKYMWIINFFSPWRKFVSVCVRMRERVRALLATALYFIQVDSKFMLPAPLALESYCKKKKKSQMKGRSNSNAAQIYSHCFSFPSWDGNAEETMLYAD